GGPGTTGNPNEDAGTLSLPGALNRGGSWFDGTAAGVFAVDAGGFPSGRSNASGVRCARPLALPHTLFTPGPPAPRGATPTHPHPQEDLRVRVHRNAKTPPKGRALLVQRVTELGWSMCAAASASGVSLRTGYKWLARYRAEGTAGFADRSCAPHHRPPAPA